MNFQAPNVSTNQRQVQCLQDLKFSSLVKSTDHHRKYYLNRSVYQKEHHPSAPIKLHHPNLATDG